MMVNPVTLAGDKSLSIYLGFFSGNEYCDNPNLGGWQRGQWPVKQADTVQNTQTHLSA
jgi:hypothetical protein